MYSINLAVFVFFALALTRFVKAKAAEAHFPVTADREESIWDKCTLL